MKFEDFRLESTPRIGSGIGWLLASQVGPRIYLAPEDGTGGGAGAGGDEGGDDKGTGADDKGAGDDTKGTGGDDGAGDDAGKDGKQNLSDDAAKILKDLMKVKDKNKSLVADNAAKEEALKKFEGIDPEKARKALKDAEEAERTAAEKSGDFERVKAMMVEAHRKDLEARDARIQELEAALTTKNKVVDELTVGNAFANSAFINEKLVLSPSKTRQIYGGHFDIEDGKLVAFDKPAGAKDRTKLVDGAGDTLSFEAALQKLVETDPDRERIVRSHLKPGASSTTTNDSKKNTQQEPLRGVAKIAAGLVAAKLASK